MWLFFGGMFKFSCCISMTWIFFSEGTFVWMTFHYSEKLYRSSKFCNTKKKLIMFWMSSQIYFRGHENVLNREYEHCSIYMGMQNRLYFLGVMTCLLRVSLHTLRDFLKTIMKVIQVN